MNPFMKPDAPANIINRFVLVVDASSSMSHLSPTVVKVVDNFIGHLAATSKDKDQETRITVYVFGSYDTGKCVIWDMDVLRVPSLAGLYHAYGNTALVQTFLKAVRDVREIPTRYGNNSVFFLGVTDGEENDSSSPRTPANQSRVGSELARVIATAPDEETYALLVPDQMGVHHAKLHGFPAGNISVWDATSVKGMEEAGRVIREVADYYMTSRAQGVKGFSARSASSGRSGLFRMNDVSAADVTTVLSPVTPGSYHFMDVGLTDRDAGSDGAQLDRFYERRTKRAYPRGRCYYEFTKPETIQGNKQVAVEVGNDVYSGTLDEVRGLLGLPDHNVRVKPGQAPGMTIFIQSNSMNRKLIPGTRLLVFR